MENKSLLLLTLLTLAFFLSGCEKEPSDFNDDDPDLCAESDSCDDGILNELLKTWNPVGGIFEGQDLTHGCVDNVCPDIQFTFLADSSYLIEKSKVLQDTSGVTLIETSDTGIYYVSDCYCRQTGNSWDGFKFQIDGKVHFTTEAGESYQLGFTFYQNSLILSQSTRDSTLVLLLN